MAKIEELEKRIKVIEERNARVEADKKWEVSWTRRISIATLTYLIIVSYFIAINNNDPLINAAVPTLGFLLSTLVLRKVRSLWQNKDR